MRKYYHVLIVLLVMFLSSTAQSKKEGLVGGEPGHRDLLKRGDFLPTPYGLHRDIPWDIFRGESGIWQNLSSATPDNRQSHPQTYPLLQAIIEDFQVNENAGPNGAWQYYPAIAVDGAGNVVVVWEDERNGDRDIYAQRYAADGTPIGNNFKVNDDNSSAGQESPAIAIDAAGNFVVVWRDERNGDWDIYAQRYAADGTPIGSNFRVNDDSGSEWQYSPAITVDGSGNFVVVWTDERNDRDGDIYAQRYAADGTPIGNNFKVNDDSGSANQYSPAIAVDAVGNFVVVWMDKRNGWDGDIYAQRYAADGTPIGGNFKVNGDTGSAGQESPAIAIDAAGNFVVVWQDERNDRDGDIYAQRYAADGTPIGDNFKVNDDQGSAGQEHPAVAMNAAGNFVVVWQDERNDDWDIYAQRYTSDGMPIGGNFKVNGDQGSAWQWVPAVAMDAAGNFVVVWHDSRNGDWDIYGQRYLADGTPIGDNFKVNDDQGSARQWFAAVAVDATGNVVVVWADKRNDSGDIYAQRYASDGTPIVYNFKVNDDQGRASQGYPAVAMDAVGNFVVVWEDKRNGWYNRDIYAQRYAADGTPIGDNFKVNDDQGSAGPEYPAVAMDAAGNFVVVWQDRRNDDWDIYAQRYAADGTPIGNNFKVNDNTGSLWQRLPSVAVDAVGNVLVVWQDGYNRNWDIYAQRYAADGTPIGDNFKVNDDSGSAEQWSPAVAMDAAGNFVVVWQDERNDDWDIYAQRYAADGTPIGSNFKVNDDQGSARQWVPAVAMDAVGNFVVVWEDERNGDWDIYGQRYSSDGTPLGNNFIVTKYRYKDQFQPDVKLWNGRIYTVWTTTHAGGTGLDIWANVLDWNDPYTRIAEDSPASVETYYLAPNYPNPFNPSTTIRYHLPRASRVKLQVYNPLGQVVRTLVEAQQPAGRYTVQWDGRDDSGRQLPAGVYFYRLKAGQFEQVRKCVKWCWCGKHPHQHFP